VSIGNLATLQAAANFAGLDSRGAEVIRLSENAIYRLPNGIVVRIVRQGQDSAAKEVNVAKWLEDAGVSAVRVLRDVGQPVVVDGQAVTFWYELPSHEHGRTADVAAALSQLHKLGPPTDFELPKLAPFVRLSERIKSAHTLTENDRAWMLERAAELGTAYAKLQSGTRECVVHGDAWAGNIVRTGSGEVVLLDFERCALGPPEWDLVSTAVSHVTTGWMDADEWSAYCDAYGKDVTKWDGFDVLRDIRELRMSSMAAQVAAKNPDKYREQAAHRVACIRGQLGVRPWSGWRAVP
jgi:aminoglycoside phosphotransferase (APT) family kinase protein